MPRFLRWFGLESAEETEDLYQRFCAHIINKSTAIYGYYGRPYLNGHWGRAQFVVRTERTEEQNSLMMTGLDTHGRGNSIWDVYATGIDLTPPNADKLSKRIAVSSLDGEHLAVVNLVNADVLPSYLDRDSLKVQMLAFPLSCEYFPDEDAFLRSLPAQGDPSNVIQDGQVIPVGLPANPEELDSVLADADRQLSIDQTLIRATVKGFLEGDVSLDEEPGHKYVRCFVDTDFGELEIVHMFDQVPEEQWDNLRAGATIVGTFALSGDVAIYDYEKGIVRDHEHNLKLLRSIMQGDDSLRIGSVLAEDASYKSDFSGQTFTGKDEIIKFFNYIKEGPQTCYAYLATIVRVDTEEDSSVPTRDVGTRCLVLSYDEPCVYESIVFIDMNEDGYITHIHTSYDPRYRFKTDWKRFEPEVSSDEA